MTLPQIDSILQDYLYESGSINIIGRNFNSATTNVLIGGKECNILNITDMEIIAEIPFLNETDVYAIIIQTANDGIKYSEPFFAVINVLSIKQIDMIPGKTVEEQEEELKPDSENESSSIFLFEPFSTNKLSR